MKRNGYQHCDAKGTNMVFNKYTNKIEYIDTGDMGKINFE